MFCKTVYQKIGNCTPSESGEINIYQIFGGNMKLKCAGVLFLLVAALFLAAAENAGRFIFLQQDGVPVYEDFNSLLAGKRKGFSDFDGKNDSSEVIDASDDSSRFHVITLPFLS